MNLFTSYNPAIIAMQSLYDQFPAATNFYLFCKEDSIKIYEIENTKDPVFALNDISKPGLISEVQKFRSQKKDVIWCDMEDLPIRKKKKDFKQISIEDEIEQNLLVFRIPSPVDELMDVFAIEFPKSFSNFYIQSGRNLMSSELKKSIGKIIREQIKWLYSFNKNQREKISKIQLAYQNINDGYSKIKEELNEEKIRNTEYLNQYLSSIIYQKEIEMNCQIRMTPEFSSALKGLHISIDKLKEVVHQCANTAFDLAINKQIIELAPHLIEVGTRHKPKDDNKSIRLIQLDKTMLLLDKYEQGARELDRSGKKINGKNLAQMLNISGPAITDAIKKHSSKISQLLEKYPNKWLLIREFVKPIREIQWKILSKNA